MIQVKLNAPNAKLPTRHSCDAAGNDIHSITEGIIPPKRGAKIRTGIKISIPAKHVGMLYGRSGLSNKYWLEVRSDIIECGNYDEIVAYFYNNSDIPFVYSVGDRIAQIVIVEVESRIEIEE